ncbi:ComF family protein [Pleurocapsales cyanobacterium LEGE 06147]|nr:ComF family protein [Pleurocapsales cyanobacterium LEGE 06147]
MFKSLLSVFLQSPCPLCKRPAENIVCVYCQKQLESCQLTNPSHLWRGNLPLFAWGVYDNKLKQAIATLKYKNQPQLGMLLGQWLGNTWLSDSVSKKTRKLTVVPIPLHRERLKARGFNQAETIARSFCQRTGYSLQPQGLVRVRDTETMFGLDPERRQQNLKYAFAVGKIWQQQPPRCGSTRSARSPVLLLDDIYTTGTTVEEAARVLRERGIKVCGVAVVARATSFKSDRSRYY